MYVYCVQMHLRTLVAERKCICTFVDMRRHLRSSTSVFHLLLLDDQERLYLTLPERKCICAQVLNCANGCAVYYFFVPAKPGLGHKVSQGLQLLHKLIKNRTSNFGNNISMYTVCSGTKLRKWMRCVLFFVPAKQSLGDNGPCHVSGIFLPLRVNSLPLATIYEVRKWKKSLLQRNPAQMTWHTIATT
jgi:hypothetical protein